MAEISKQCRMCGSAGPHRTVTVREMYYGTRELFEYYVCADCQTLQIVDVLEGEELARHYPRKYYSYNASQGPRLLQWLTTQRDRHDLRDGARTVGALIAALPPGIRSLIGTNDASGDVVKMLGQLNVGRDARILDVGCGGGALLDRLARAGFRNLFGADPFVDADTTTPTGVPIARQFMEDVSGEFDVIMFNHSLEHVPDPVATLKAARARLAHGGICLARVPTTSSEAWDLYGKNWCLIDAPRHTLVPSRPGMERAAEAVGMRLEQTIDDSNASQFFGSEMYRTDTALTEAGGFGYLFKTFGVKRLWEWERRSVDLNRQGRGDQTGFVLRAT
ncbi:class I SAM-dependent methyltransferase [Mycolicibacterium goodii]|uniref:Class I SAM-dependent methyltransferase n=1 Tax=Mycolicibacterium goodii TaxID=134601 RepID=A0ABS6HJW1_MYCGD|nr:class I SAM-dependent methyltransferase [Mycolicibacterium goodii]OKH74318.1 methyltransferase [Mycobacterium sp. SWH-M5]MBU8808387.1 class I SAM-dependent methyltransferase [Mycolicibacterium goodii]MBU8822870.1 class I SAM-dependent methyltransferase [Mycolicibacterium goodii]MBU8829197.1 class I SAM-dependent methyltransferase [Mycolicibacterium goodii]MBU8839152.1 class I SAM-dependent methyltransferase [Mycolicibacterium goodii]